MRDEFIDDVVSDKVPPAWCFLTNAARRMRAGKFWNTVPTQDGLRGERHSNGWMDSERCNTLSGEFDAR